MCLFTLQKVQELQTVTDSFEFKGNHHHLQPFLWQAQGLVSLSLFVPDEKKVMHVH